MRNARGHQKVKKKKVNKNTYDISFIKRVTRFTFWKFHVVVVQNNDKKMYKKVCCRCKVAFVLITITIHDFMFYLSKL